MANATVISITGRAWARDAEGNVRELSVGDTLQEGEVLETSDNGSAQLDFGDGQDPILIEGGEQVAMTPELDVDEIVDASEFAALDEDLEALLAALDDDSIDLLDVLDATAAGAGPGGAADGGHSFVRLARIAEDTNPLAFEYGMNALGGLPEEQGGALLTAGEEGESEVVIPDPTVTITTFDISSTNNEVSSVLVGAATNATGVIVTLTGPNGTVTFEVDVDVEGNWSVDLFGLELPEGSYTVVAIAVNQQGTQSEPATADSGYTLPTVAIDTFTIGSEGNEVGAELNGSATNASHVSVTLT
ncbi:MAG: retention module-containing protein, partial [Billgrantia sp.]